MPKILTPGKYLRISIADKGPGINKEHLSHIFDPFFTTKEVGHGLGLSIAYSIVKKHNGFISVESEMGKGTVFHVYLPVAEGSVLPTETEKSSQQSEKAKILVMDDEPAILDIASRILKNVGYTVECATRGEEAVRLYKEALGSAQPFNAVILDLTVRDGQGGTKTLEELYRIDPKVVAIVCSGYADDPAMANPQAYGFKGAMAKPYRAKEIQEVLRKTLEDS